jgi:two-component system, NtrC family, sensor histidine kinase GlrK
MRGMRLPRPKSLSSLMLTGFALVSVPLLFAVVIAVTKVRALSEESAALVRSGVETAHLTQQLFQQIASIERSAKLYQVLNDPGLIDVYRDSRERFLVTLNNIETAAADGVGRTQLQALRQSLRRVDGALLARCWHEGRLHPS